MLPERSLHSQDERLGRHGNDHPPARLLDIIEGRSSNVLRLWLNERDQQFRDTVHVIAVDGFTGYACAANDVIPKAKKVMDPFHVVRLAGDKLTTRRRRLQQETLGRRGKKDDPLYKNRKTLLTRQHFLTEKQKDRLEDLFRFDDDYAPPRTARTYYQQIIDCYDDPDKRRVKKAMMEVISQAEREEAYRACSTWSIAEQAPQGYPCVLRHRCIQWAC